MNSSAGHPRKVERPSRFPPPPQLHSSHPSHPSFPFHSLFVTKPDAQRKKCSPSLEPSSLFPSSLQLSSQPVSLPFLSSLSLSLSRLTPEFPAQTLALSPSPSSFLCCSSQLSHPPLLRCDPTTAERLVRHRRSHSTNPSFLQRSLQLYPHVVQLL